MVLRLFLFIERLPSVKNVYMLAGVIRYVPRYILDSLYQVRPSYLGYRNMVQDGMGARIEQLKIVFDIAVYKHR